MDAWTFIGYPPKMKLTGASTVVHVSGFSAVDCLRLALGRLHTQT
jgi:hypothetical protein